MEESEREGKRVESGRGRRPLQIQGLGGGEIAGQGQVGRTPLLLRTGRGQELAHVFGIVRLLVGLEYRRTGKCLAAQGTSERSLACVDTAMIFHVVSQLESLAAEFTLERSVSRVDR